MDYTHFDMYLLLQLTILLTVLTVKHDIGNVEYTELNCYKAPYLYDTKYDVICASSVT